MSAGEEYVGELQAGIAFLDDDALPTARRQLEIVEVAAARLKELLHESQHPDVARSHQALFGAAENFKNGNEKVAAVIAGLNEAVNQLPH